MTRNIVKNKEFKKFQNCQGEHKQNWIKNWKKLKIVNNKKLTKKYCKEQRILKMPKLSRRKKLELNKKLKKLKIYHELWKKLWKIIFKNGKH